MLFVVLMFRVDMADEPDSYAQAHRCARLHGHHLVHLLGGCETSVCSHAELGYSPC